MNPRAIGVVGLLALALAGCGDYAGHDDAEKNAIGRMQRNAAVAELVRDYQQARAAGQWDLALSYADRLEKLAPGNALDSSVRSTLSDTRMRAEAEREKSHLAALWTYQVVALTGSSNQIALITASILSDDDGGAANVEPARLVMRNHPQLGHSAGLVLDKGKFGCARKCTVSVQFDDQPARPFAASLSPENPHALNIDDEQAVRASLDKIRVLTIGVVVDGKPRSLKFSVGGFDRVQLERKIQ